MLTDRDLADIARALRAAFPDGRGEELLGKIRPTRAEDVEWVVNSIAELGVKIGERFFFFYKGRSLVYEDPAGCEEGPMHWRHVWKREFGECVHPINYRDPSRTGTVSLSDSDDWKPLPAQAENT